MDKLEKVIKGLECCTKKVCIYKDTEKEGPYSELCGEYEDSFEDCTTALSKDALVLLKAQEPVMPIMIHGEYECGFCRNEVSPDSNTFCACCGRKVKWE